VGWDSVGDTATRYGLDGPGSNPDRGEYSAPFTLVLETTQPPVQRVPVNSWVKAAGVWR